MVLFLQKSKDFTSINLPRRNPLRNPIQQKKLKESIKNSSLIKEKEVVKNINPIN